MRRNRPRYWIGLVATSCRDTSSASRCRSMTLLPCSDQEPEVIRDPKKDPLLDTSRRVAELTAQLEAAKRELEAFSYSVAHDLRAPLRHIDGFARLALEKSSGLDETLVKHLDTVIQAAA